MSSSSMSRRMRGSRGRIFWRRRAGGLLLVVAIVLACAGVVAWLAWREPRDEEYARLQRDPDEPRVAPGAPDAPRDEPSARPPSPAPVGATVVVGGGWQRPAVAPATPAAEPARAAQSPVSAPLRAHVTAYPPLPSATATPPSFVRAGTHPPAPAAARPSLPF